MKTNETNCTLLLNSVDEQDEAAIEMANIEVPRNAGHAAFKKDFSFEHVEPATDLSNLIKHHTLSASQESFHGAKVKVKNKVKLLEHHDVLSIKSNQKEAKIIYSGSNSITSEKSATTKSWFDFSYVVLVASFLSYMLASLLSSCFGVFFESMEADLGWSKGKCAFIGALLSALNDLAGPISSALTNRYGCRKTTIFGGLIAALGVIGSAYAEDFWLLGLLMGGVSGFGSSLVLVASVVVVTYYFEDKPSFAAGLTISGASFGQSIFTMIIIKLNEVYGRSGCFLILGGILLNIVVCGALFRPLQWELEDESEEDEDESSSDEEDEELSEESEHESEPKKTQLEVGCQAPIASVECLSHLNEMWTNNTKKPSSTINVNTEQVKNTLSSKNLTKEFSSDSCLDYKPHVSSSSPFEMPSIGNSSQLLDKNELNKKSIISMQLFSPYSDECQSLKSKDPNDFYSNYKPLDRHHSLQVLKSTKSQQENNFSKSVHSLKLFTSLLSFAQTQKSNEQCDLDREELEKAGFLVVDADELANCNSKWNSANGVFFPFITNEEMNNINENETYTKETTLTDQQSLADESKANEVLGLSNFNETLIDQVTSKQVDDQLEVKFSHGLNSEAAKNPSIFNKFSEFFTSKRAKNITAESDRSNLLKPSNQLVVRLDNNQLTVANPKKSAKYNVSNQPGLTAVERGENLRKKLANNNQHYQLFIKPVRTAQNGQRFIIARCNCQERLLQRSKRRSVANIESNAPEACISQTGNSANPPLDAKANIAGKNKNFKFNSAQRTLRHFQDCPVNYLNRLNSTVQTYPNPVLHHHHHHHHHHHQQSNRSSFTYIPSVFQNSYRFPLHFKNVYYYKSLINLNMRLMHLKNHGNNPTRIATDASNNNTNFLNNLSLSCPDLNLNQVLLINSSNKKLAPLKANKPLQIFTVNDLKTLKQQAKPPKGVKLDQQLQAGKANTQASKVLNAGSIVLNPAGSTRPLSIKTKKQMLQEKTLANTIKNAGLTSSSSLLNNNNNKTSGLGCSALTLNDFNDKILEEQVDEPRKGKPVHEEDSSSSSSSSSGSDEESDEEECDNCFVRTKCGNYFYKFFWKPTVTPLKYICYSIGESLKLFYLFKFSVFALCNFILSFFYEAPFYFINTYMIDNGSTNYQAGTINVAVGIVCIFSSSRKF